MNMIKKDGGREMIKTKKEEKKEEKYHFHGIELIREWKIALQRVNL